MTSSRGARDVIVVGGGPAGSALSVLLGRAGCTVTLFEKARFPREKPCGEGMLPPGVDVLEDLGLRKEVGGRPLEGVRYHVGADSVRAGFGCDDFGRARHGLGQRRSQLDRALWQEACRTRGVEAYEGTPVVAPLVEQGRVTGVLAADKVWRSTIVVAADGSSSTLRRKLGMEVEKSPRRVGVRAHFHCPPGQVATSDIQVFLRQGYELYVTPLPKDEVVVAALAYTGTGGPSLRRSFARWMRDEPLVRNWLDGASQTSELMGRGPLLKRSSGVRPPDGLILLGDAAESVDPVTAGGMTLALSNAQVLSHHMSEILRGSARAQREFTRCQKRSVRLHAWLGAGLRMLSQSPFAASSAKNLIQVHPPAMDALVALATTRAGT